MSELLMLGDSMRFLKPRFKPIQFKPIEFPVHTVIRRPRVGEPTSFDRREPQNRAKPLPKQMVKAVAFDRVRNSPRAIYGSTALVKQIPNTNRVANDTDIWSQQPMTDCDVMEDKLDSLAGGDAYYEQVVEFDDAIDGHKKLYQVVDRESGKSVMDFSQKPENAQTVKLDDISYEELKAMREKLIRIMNDPRTSEKRYIKTAKDLRIIDKFLGIRK